MGIQEEVALLDEQNNWQEFYHEIRVEDCEKHNFSLKASKMPEYKNRNRYRDVSPYDHSRIVLLRNSLDYINANKVCIEKANRSYILTQGPLATTSGHFWLMVLEQQSTAIVMLNKVVEKEREKCHQYFPTKLKEEMNFPEVSLSVKMIGESFHQFFYMRTFEIYDKGTSPSKQFMVKQFHYTAWPDFGVPESPADFLYFLLVVREAGCLDASVGPSVVHCSAGIGRSGTFCLIDSCLKMIEENGSDNDINVRSVLMEMRRHRMGLIQTHDQLRFSYLAIAEGSSRILADQFTLDSLKSALTAGNNNCQNEELVTRTPPPGPNHANSITDSDDNMINGTVTVRRRAREEKIKSTSEKVQKMKEKLQAHELSSDQSYFGWAVGMGVGLLCGLAGLYVYFMYAGART